MVNVPPGVQQAHPSLPPHVQQGVANAQAGARAGDQRWLTEQPSRPSHGSFGAIAYSPSTSHAGWSSQCDTEQEAVQSALDAEGRSTDAFCLITANYKFLAVVKGPKGIGTGSSWRKKVAVDRAYRRCPGLRGKKIVILFHTDVGDSLL